MMLQITIQTLTSPSRSKPQNAPVRIVKGETSSFKICLDCGAEDWRCSVPRPAPAVRCRRCLIRLFRLRLPRRFGLAVLDTKPMPRPGHRFGEANAEHRAHQVKCITADAERKIGP